MGLLEVEDEQHFLERCPVLQEARQPMMKLLQGQKINGETISNTTNKGKLNYKGGRYLSFAAVK